MYSYRQVTFYKITPSQLPHASNLPLRNLTIELETKTQIPQGVEEKFRIERVTLLYQPKLRREVSSPKHERDRRGLPGEQNAQQPPHLAAF